ncbi:Uncharacterized protein DAT39_020383 [Clarias magur]|uniref:Uncharacterized protein n=1 Tax=Clarias magur TaxID=1594786 RepID=A0A8J4TYY0_CLAMG|nr:Uncharacterized protein DAT39_020383 [Clarias magur]
MSKIMVTVVEVSIVLCVLGERDTVSDLQAVVNHQSQQDPLRHLAALPLLLQPILP